MTTKFGLNYFQVRVDFFNTKNARLLNDIFGLAGIVIYFEVMADIFENGYYIKLDDDYFSNLAMKNNIKKERVKNIIRKLVDWEVYDQAIYEEHAVLTSIDIQNHYAIVKKKNLDFRKEAYPYLLIDLTAAIGSKKACCKRRKKEKTEQISQTDEKHDEVIENHSVSEDVPSDDKSIANDDNHVANNIAQIEREKKRTKRKENEVKGSEEKRRIKIKNNFYIESSRSLNACDHAHEGGERVSEITSNL